jgi:23S rRNA (guanine745-N1)-methyltransferase
VLRTSGRKDVRVRADLLACPHCRGDLELAGKSLRCPRGHSFDVARQGYVTLTPGGALRHHGDTRAMVAARAAFLAGGRFDPILAHVADLAALPAEVPGAVIDVGAGSGHYLARVLDSQPGRAGLALDASRPAAAMSARAHARADAVVCDVWGELPVRTGVAAVVLNVFAPRNGPEMRRVLDERGTLVVVHPTARHLHEIVAALDLLAVGEDKTGRIEGQLEPWFEPIEGSGLEYTVSLDADELEALVAMGPSAWHVDGAALGERIGALGPPVEVTISVSLTSYRPLSSSS